MRLISFRKTPITEESYRKGVSRRLLAKRWALHFQWLHLSLERESLWNDRGWDDFVGCGEYFSIAVSRRFVLGPEHFYYDGPHCSFCFGFLHVCWSYWWCTKCMPED